MNSEDVVGEASSLPPEKWRKLKDRVTVVLANALRSWAPKDMLFIAFADMVVQTERLLGGGAEHVHACMFTISLSSKVGWNPTRRVGSILHLNRPQLGKRVTLF